MSASSPAPKLSAADLDMVIDATAKVLADTAAAIHLSDPMGRLSMARALDGLLRYREAREAREHRARMSAP